MKPRILSSARLSFPLAAAIAALLASHALHAASGTWTSTGSGNWTDSTRWSGGTIADGAGFTASFTANITGDRTVTLNADRTIGNITFTDPTPSHNLTISGANILTLDVTTGAPILDSTQSGRTLTIASVVAGNDGLTKNGAGAVALTGLNTYTGVTTITAGTLSINRFTNGGVAGSLGQASNAPVNLVMTGGTLSYTGGSTTTDRGMTLGALSGNSIVTVSSTSTNLNLTNLIAGTASQQIDFTKGGTGTLTLSNDNNSYIGRSFVSGGTLAVTSISAVGSATSSLGVATTAANGLISIGTAAVTTTLSYIGTGHTTDRDLNLPGTAGGAVIEHAGTGLLKFTGAVGATGVGSKTLTLRGSTIGTGEIAGVIVDNGTTGTTVATAASTASTSLVLGSVLGLTVGNTISGTGIPASPATTITAINPATRTVTLSAAATVASGAVITSSGLVNLTSLTKDGTGTWAITGANTYTGTTTVNAGTLDLGGGTATGSLASPTLALGGGILAYTRTGSATQGFTTTNITAVTASPVSVAAGNTLNLGTVTRAVGGWADFSTPGSGIVAAQASSNVGGIMPGIGFGNTWAVANGDGVPISGLGSYTLTSAAGTTAANYTGNNIDVDSSAGTLDGPITTNSLRFNTPAANTVTLAGTPNVITSGGIFVTSDVAANLSTITGGELAGAASQDLAIIQNNTLGGLTISSAIANNVGATGLTKSGPGLLTLGGANTYTGLTAVSGGTLQLSGAGTLGAAGSSVSVSSGALLDLNGTNQTIRSVAGAGVGTVANNSGSGTSILTLAGTGTVSGSLITIVDNTTTPGGKVGVVLTTNTQPLSNLNTYSGGTTVNAGAFLYLTASSVAGGGNPGPISLPASGGTTSVSSGLLVDSVTYSNDISGAGYVHNNTDGTGTAVFTGTLNTSGTFNFRNSAAAFNFAGSGTSTLSGVIGPAGTGQTTGPNDTVSGGSIIKSGIGTLTLSGANVYSGTTTVSAGTLNLSGARTATAGPIIVGNQLATTATLNISNGTFTTGNFSVGSGDNPLTAGIVNQTGGTLTMSGNQLLLGNLGTGTTAGSNSTGTYNLSGGTLNTVAGGVGVLIGVNQGTTGIFNLSGTGVLNMAATSTMQIGRSDANIVANTTGTFNQTGGTATVGILRIGGAGAATSPGTTATLSLTGGTFSAVTFDALSFGDNSTSAITIGGTADVTLPQFPQTGLGAGSTATIAFDGGTLKNSAASTNYLGVITGASIKAGGAKFDTTGGNSTITHNLLEDGGSSGGGLTKLGPNTLTLAGVNTYTGDTTVSTGTLALADNAQLKFVLGASSGINNSLTGAGTVTLDGDFDIDTTAADGLATGTWTLVDHSGLAETYSSTFTVAGFTDAGGNKWTKPNGPSKLYTFDEATGVLTLGPSASYASWINGFFPGETNSAIIGSTADPDKDGIENGAEMVVGGNPATGMDTALLPTSELVTDPAGVPAGNYLLFTFRRSDLSVTAGLTSACETDTDLVGTWTTAVNGVGGVVILTDDNFTFTPPAAADTDRVRVYVPRGANPKLFGRLNVVVP